MRTPGVALAVLALGIQSADGTETPLEKPGAVEVIVAVESGKHVFAFDPNGK